MSPFSHFCCRWLSAGCLCLSITHPLFAARAPQYAWVDGYWKTHAVVYGLMERPSKERGQKTLRIKPLATIAGFLQPQAQSELEVGVHYGPFAVLDRIPPAKKYPAPVLFVLESSDNKLQVANALLYFMPNYEPLVVVDRFDDQQIAEIQEGIRSSQERHTFGPLFTSFAAKREGFWKDYTLVVARVQKIDKEEPTLISLEVLSSIAGWCDPKETPVIQVANRYQPLDKQAPRIKEGFLGMFFLWNNRNSFLIEGDIIEAMELPEANVSFLPTNSTVVPLKSPEDPLIEEIRQSINAPKSK